MIEEFTRKEYELLYNAFKHYRVFMDDEQEVMSEKILDKIFYPSFDKISKPDFPRENWEAIT